MKVCWVQYFTSFLPFFLLLAKCGQWLCVQLVSNYTLCQRVDGSFKPGSQPQKDEPPNACYVWAAVRSKPSQARACPMIVALNSTPRLDSIFEKCLNRDTPKNGSLPRGFHSNHPERGGLKKRRASRGCPGGHESTPRFSRRRPSRSQIISTCWRSCKPMRFACISVVHNRPSLFPRISSPFASFFWGGGFFGFLCFPLSRQKR